MTDNQGVQIEPGHDHLHGDGSNSSTAADVNQLLSQFNFGDLLAGFDAFDQGSAEGGDEVDAVPDEEPDGIACGGDQELAVAALSGIPNAGAARRRRKDRSLKTFDEEDFEEGAERLAFRVLKANIECIFDKKAPAQNHVTAAHWVFAYTDGDFSFDNCCALLGAREDVMRLRIHYELWRLWYVFPVEFPFTIVSVPEEVHGAIKINAGDIGLELARAAWVQPGIRTKDLIEKVSEKLGGGEWQKPQIEAALEKLSNSYHLSVMNDSWYLTGRNPILRAMDITNATYRRQSAHLSWSRLF